MSVRTLETCHGKHPRSPICAVNDHSNSSKLVAKVTSQVARPDASAGELNGDYTPNLAPVELEMEPRDTFKRMA